MTFDSLQFIFFFLALCIAYFSVPGTWQRPLLFIASCYFYMVFVPYYILILFFLIGVDYTLGRAIADASGRKRVLYFALSLISNLGILFFFKYFNFFNYNIGLLAHFLHWNYPIGFLQVALPLGLSFHIFQSLSYIIEVYKGKYPPERNVLTYALYVMLFSQLVAGPIERPSHLLPQLKKVHTFEYERVVSGLWLMFWGFFKKVAIANWLAVSVDFIYADLPSADASVLIIAVFAFALQLYADFSGYSDIAVGSARVLGIELTQNFNRPYFSRSVSELWRRWHISLSSWFRDYVYFPLMWWSRGRGVYLTYACILITFMLTGVWHGAGWNFVAMGVLFGTYISIEQMTQKVRARLWHLSRIAEGSVIKTGTQVILTFIFTSLAWIFFRAPSLSDAISMLHKLLTDWGAHSFWYLHCGAKSYCISQTFGLSKTQLLTVLCSVLILFVYELIQEGAFALPALLRKKAVVLSACYALIIWFFLAGHFAPKTFIYFQF